MLGQFHTFSYRLLVTTIKLCIAHAAILCAPQEKKREIEESRIPPLTSSLFVAQGSTVVLFETPSLCAIDEFARCPDVLTGTGC